MTEPTRPLSPPPPTRPFLVTLLRDWGIAIGVVLAVLLVVNALLRPGGPALGPAPDFVLTDLEGRSVRLSEVDDELVVLNFWFTSCGPCRSEIPHFSRFHEAHPDVPLYGVSTDRGMPTGQLKAHAKRLGITYPVLHDVQVDVAEEYGVSAYPTTLVVADGRIVASRVGTLDEKGLTALVDDARGRAAD